MVDGVAYIFPRAEFLNFFIWVFLLLWKNFLPKIKNPEVQREENVDEKNNNGRARTHEKNYITAPSRENDEIRCVCARVVIFSSGVFAMGGGLRHVSCFARVGITRARASPPI